MTIDYFAVAPNQTAIETQTLRTVTRICAPIFSNFVRMVDTWASASSVACNPSRRNPLTRIEAMADYSRICLPRIVSVLTRSANKLNCSLMRFSMSPRAQ